MMLFLLLGMLLLGLLLMTFEVYFGPIPVLGVLLLLAALPFLVEVCYVFVTGVWEAELLVAGGSGRLYRVSQGDEVDQHCAQYFVNSSLSPVLLFRRRLKSVADVLNGIRNKGFTQSRWDALLGFWDAACRHGPCVVLFPPFILGTVGFLRISMASTSGFLIPLRC